MYYQIIIWLKINQLGLGRQLKVFKITKAYARNRTAGFKAIYLLTFSILDAHRFYKVAGINVYLKKNYH